MTNDSVLAADCNKIMFLCNYNGIVSGNVLLQPLRLKGVVCRKSTIVSLSNKVIAKMPIEWIQLLRDKVSMPNMPVEIQICLSGKTCNVWEIKSKQWYVYLKENKCKKPTAEKRWETFFPGKNGEVIWKNIEIPNSSPEIFHVDFKLRHR